GDALLLIDRAGTVLARHPEGERWTGHRLLDGGTLRAVVERRDGAAEMKGVDGVERIYRFVPVGSAQSPVAFVAVGVSRSTALAAANRIFQRGMLGLLVVLMLALGAAWVVGDAFIARPLARVSDATRRLAAGDLGARVGPRYASGEIGRLARAFDGLARSL